MRMTANDLANVCFSTVLRNFPLNLLHFITVAKSMWVAYHEYGTEKGNEHNRNNNTS